MKYILIGFFIITGTFAQVNTGDGITAKIFNESSSHIGEIKHSLLTEAEFQNIYGSCWVKMRGQCISTSCGATVTSDLAQATGGRLNSLPNSSGRFLRDIDGNAPSLGETQDDAIRNITGEYHSYGMANSDVGRTAVTNGAFREGTTNRNSRSGALGGSNSLNMIFDASQVVPVANENRPVNLGVNYFIKINKECN